MVALLFLLCVRLLEAQPVINRPIQGFQYFPGVIGLRGTYDKIDVYLQAAHKLDLSTIAKTGANTVLVATDGIVFDDRHESFFELADKNNLQVIMAFSFLKYNLPAIMGTASWDGLVKEIERDVKILIENHKDWNHLVMWTVGSPSDTELLRADEPDEQAFLISLLTDVYDLFAHGDPTRQVSLFIPTGLQELFRQRIFDALPDLNEYILDLGLSDNLREIPLTKPGGPRPIIQFSTDHFALDNRDEAAVRMNNIFPLLKAQNYTNIIVREWADQWWRGGDECDANPYFQKPCITLQSILTPNGSYATKLEHKGYMGVVQVVDTFGYHCVQVTPALIAVLSQFISDPTALATQIDAMPIGKRFCYFHYKLGVDTSSPAWAIGLIVVVIVLSLFTLFVWFRRWRRAQRISRTRAQYHGLESKPDQSEKKTETEPKKEDKKEDKKAEDKTEDVLGHPGEFRSGSEKVKVAVLARNPGASFEFPHFPGIFFRVSWEEVQFIKKKEKPKDLEGKEIKDAKEQDVFYPNYDSKKTEDIVKGLVHVREHVKNAAHLVHTFLEHETAVCNVLKAEYKKNVLDRGLTEKGGYEKATAAHNDENHALKVVWNRMLEGYLVWYKKTQGGDFEFKLEEAKGQILLFRLLCSISEHVMYCPERLCDIFNFILAKKEIGKTKSGDNKLTYPLDMKHVLFMLAEVIPGKLNFDDMNDEAAIKMGGCCRGSVSKPAKYWVESSHFFVAADFLRNYSDILVFKAWLFVSAYQVFQEGFVGLKKLDFWVVVGFVDAAYFAGLDISLIVLRLFNIFKLKNFCLEFEWTFITACAVFGVQLWILIAGQYLKWMIYAYLPILIAGFVIRSRYFMPFVLGCLTRRVTQYYDAQMNGNVRQERAGFWKCGLFNRASQKVFWIVAFLLTWVVEYLWVAPIIAHITIHTLCDDVCQPYTPLTGLASSRCNSCYLAVASIYALAILTVLIDTPIVFVLCVSATGYMEGRARKVNNAFQKSGSDADFRLEGTDRMDMECLFGVADPLWDALIDDLYNRDLITKANRDKLKKGMADDSVVDFSYLDPEPRQRLCFFMRTVRGMASEIKKFENIQEDARKEFTRNRAGAYKLLQQEKERTAASSASSASSSASSSAPPPPIAIAPASSGAFPQSGPVVDAEAAEHKGRAAAKSRAGRMKGDYTEMAPPPMAKHPTGTMPTTSARMWTPLQDPEYGQPLFLDTIPRLSHIITIFNETIMPSRTYLQKINGGRRNLEHLINQNKENTQEWNNFLLRKSEKKEPPDSEKKELGDFLGKWDAKTPGKAVELFMGLGKDEYTGADEWKTQFVLDVREWASYRSQTVARTIRGALTYHRSLEFRLNHDERKRDEEKAERRSVSEFTELIIAFQTYASYPGAAADANAINEWIQRREDVNRILRDNKNFPIKIVFDIGQIPNVKPPTPEERQKDPLKTFNHEWYNKMNKYWEEDRSQILAYLGQEYDGKVPNFQFATVIKGCDATGNLAILSFLPRVLPLRLGEGKNLTQGKAANHLNALRAVSGHVIQVSDANMDAWFGEAMKVPFVTRCVTEGNCFSFKDLIRREQRCVADGTYSRLDRARVKNRIVGFREYIYTGTSGTVGEAMAWAEFTFGTIFQRVLAQPLQVRMHYGHPDFFDAFWSLNRGGLSKGSPQINLSEDIFAGYRVILREEKIHHVDILEWQKGRETQFVAASGFLSKVSGGAVAMLRSRDLYQMQTSLDLWQRLGLFYGGIGNYFFHLCVDWSMSCFVLIFFFTSLGNVSLNTIGSLESSLSVEWVFSWGFMSGLPLLSELMLEYGSGTGMVMLLLTLIPMSLFFLFQNKMISASIKTGIRTGEAPYVETGRPDSFDHYELAGCYRSYVRSHYHPALFLLIMYGVYRHMVSETGGHKPMYLVLLQIVAYFVTPVIFCPQAGNVDQFQADFHMIVKFVTGLAPKKQNLLNFWAQQLQKDMDFENPIGQRVITTLGSTIPFILCFVCFPATFIDFGIAHFGPFVVHILLTVILLSSRDKQGGFDNATAAVWLIFPAAAVLWLSNIGPFPVGGAENFLGLLIFLCTVHFGFYFFVLVASLLNLWPFKLWTKVKEHNAKITADKLSLAPKPSFEIVVYYFYLFFLKYHLYFYCAAAIAFFQLLCQAAIVALTVIWEGFVKLAKGRA